ncbi:MAG: hypothetical protein AAF728_10160, partial [Cyanobacteria bacterium P01_D01_bin.128]
FGCHISPKHPTAMNAPAIFLQLPAAIVALPITLFLESWFRYEAKLGISRRKRFITALMMNLFSIFLGIPAVYVTGFAILYSAFEEQAIPDWLSGVYVIVPNPAAGLGTTVLWLVPVFISSVLIEMLIAQRYLSSIAPAKIVCRWVMKANGISHAGLAIALLIYWFFVFRI